MMAMLRSTRRMTVPTVTTIVVSGIPRRSALPDSFDRQVSCASSAMGPACQLSGGGEGIETCVRSVDSGDQRASMRAMDEVVQPEQGDAGDPPPAAPPPSAPRGRQFLPRNVK